MLVLRVDVEARRLDLHAAVALALLDLIVRLTSHAKGADPS